jgi:hypothetical protein
MNMQAPKAEFVFSGFPGCSVSEDSMFVFEKGILLGRETATEHLMLCKFSPDSVEAFPGQTEAGGSNVFGNFGQFILRNKYVTWCCHRNFEDYWLRVYNIETMQCDFEMPLPWYVLLHHIEPQDGPDDSILFYAGEGYVVHFVEVIFSDHGVPIGLEDRPELTWKGTPGYNGGVSIRKGVRQIGLKLYTRTVAGVEATELQYSDRNHNNLCILHGDCLFTIDEAGVLSCFSMVLQKREWSIETALTNPVTPAVFGNLVVCASCVNDGLEVVDWRKKITLLRYASRRVHGMRFVGKKLWLFLDTPASSPIALQLDI